MASSSERSPSPAPRATPASASASTLNPLAPAFSPTGPSPSWWPDRLQFSGSALSFSDDEMSDDGYVSPSFLDVKGKGKARDLPPSRTGGPSRGGFMADARRTGAAGARCAGLAAAGRDRSGGGASDEDHAPSPGRRSSAVLPGRLRSVVGAQDLGPLEEEAAGWTTVVHRRRHRSRVRPAARQDVRRPGRASRPVPQELEGRCFNCLSWDHMAAACRESSRCFRCNEEGHQARECWRVRRRRRRTRPQ